MLWTVAEGGDGYGWVWQVGSGKVRNGGSRCGTERQVMNPDLLICWHESCDYPICRYTLKTYRNFYGKIIIYFSKHFREPVYTEFLKASLKDLGNIVFLDPVEYHYGVEDWRNVATHEMLKQSNSEWVCSVEQDFFVKDWNKLLSAVTSASKEYDLIGYSGKQGQQTYQQYLTNDYVHPAFWFMKREALEKTHKNFSAAPLEGADHFGLITRSAIDNRIPIKYINELGFVDFVDDFHMGGTNQNYLEFERPEYVIYRPEMFLVYNYWSMKCPVVQSPIFMDKMIKMDQRLRTEHPEIDPESDKWSEFFKS